jgi:hypothetical protein
VSLIANNIKNGQVIGCVRFSIELHKKVGELSIGRPFWFQSLTIEEQRSYWQLRGAAIGCFNALGGVVVD